MATGTTGIDYTALNRALDECITAKRRGRTTWEVNSRGNRYQVVYCSDSDIRSCDCMAGKNGRSCKHVALVQVLARSGAVPVPTHELLSATRRAEVDAYFSQYDALMGGN